MKPTSKTPERSSAPKATLYCPVCGHQSPVTGDWILCVSGDAVNYECPECGSTITTRPLSSEPTVESDTGLRYCSCD